MKNQLCLLTSAIFIVTAAAITEAHAQTVFWQQTDGPNGGRVNALAVNSSGYVFAATDSGVFVSTDEGLNWSHRGLRNTRSLAIDADNRIFADSGNAGNDDYVFRSTDNGQTWANVLSVPSVGSGGVAFLLTNSINHIFAAITYFFTVNWGYILRSTDNGMNWTTLTGAGTWAPTAFVVDLQGYSYEAGYLCRACVVRVQRSTDEGDTWAEADSGMYHLVDPIDRVIAFAYDSQNHLYGGTSSGYLYFSTNQGNLWTACDTLPSGISAMVFSSHDNLFAATSGSGVYRNSTPLNSGLTDSNVVALAISPSGYIFAGTQSGIAFRSVQRVVSVEQPKVEHPTRIALGQNYPNPFNPSTTIKYELPRTSNVTLSIVDVLGREVSVLVNERREAGVHEVKFDGSNLASGVYFSRLQAGDFVAVKKMLVLR